MKKLILFLAFGLTGVFAHASTEAVSTNDEASVVGNRLWACGLTFKGTSKGLKVIVGHHWIGPTAGVGYFKLAGASSEISLFNSSPDVILGKYLVAQGEAAIIGGVGAFTAVNISLQLLHGVGVQVGIDKLTISAVD